MTEPVREVPAELLIRANNAAAKGRRGFENATISITALTRSDDVSGLTMNLHGREYSLINEAAFKAAATCPLVLRGSFGDSEFDREEFLRLALSFAEQEGSG